MQGKYDKLLLECAILIMKTFFRTLNNDVLGQVLMQTSASMLLMNVSVLMGYNRHQVVYSVMYIAKCYFL